MKAFVLLSPSGTEIQAIEVPHEDMLDPPSEVGRWIEVPMPVRDNTVDAQGNPIPRIKPEREAAQLLAIQRKAIKDAIVAIEATQPRAIRDFALTGDRVRLQNIEDKISALRSQLAE